mgnify:CR=1 FL=1
MTGLSIPTTPCALPGHLHCRHPQPSLILALFPHSAPTAVIYDSHRVITYANVRRITQSKRRSFNYADYKRDEKKQGCA